MTTFGFIGSGNIGSSVARAALAAGHDVVMSNSRGPDTLGDLITDLGEHASAASAAGAAEAGEVVVVTIPMKNYAAVPVEPLAGKIVIDTNNYYPARDGEIAELLDESTTSAELLAAHLPSSRVVKAFNHIRAAEILTDASPAQTTGRRALVIAGDDADARAVVAAFIDEIGFDVVDLGPLAEGWRIQPDTPGYGPRLDAAAIAEATASATRRSDAG